MYIYVYVSMYVYSNNLNRTEQLNSINEEHEKIRTPKRIHICVYVCMSIFVEENNVVSINILIRCTGIIDEYLHHNLAGTQLVGIGICVCVCVCISSTYST